MLSAKAETTIQRPIGDVYEFMADFTQNARWCPQELEGRLLDGDGRTQRFENKVKPGPRVLTNHYEVTRDDPPRRITFRGSNEMADFDGFYELSETGAGTRVVIVSNLAAHSRGMRVLSQLLRPMIKATATKQSQLLKQVLENGA